MIKDRLFYVPDNGVLLGLYRDGVVLEDGDVDIRVQLFKPEHPQYKWPISLEDGGGILNRLRGPSQRSD